MNWNILHKYLSGECSEEEVSQIKDWLDTDQNNRKFMNSLEKIWNVEPGDEIKVDERDAWKSFQQKKDDKWERLKKEKSVYKSGEYRQQTSTYKDYSHTLAVALSAAAVILIALLFSQNMSVDNENIQPQPRFAMQEIMTSKGQRTNFRLSDGTRVQLNADSKINIPGDFMSETREVYLEGEAFFEANHNADKPFIVYSADASTRVLGTKFGIRAYPEEEQTRIIVTEGRVSFGGEEESITKKYKQVTQNQMGVLSEDGNVEVSAVNNIRQYLGWRNGELVFEDTPLTQVKAHLERWYDINCTVVDSSLYGRRITASFSNGEPMEEVLSVVALSMDMTYNRKGRNINFMKN